MLQEPFAIGNSFVHQLDPRLRLISACVYSTVVALSRSFHVLTAAALISFLWVVLAQLPVRDILKRIIVLNSFNVLLWIVLPLTFQGPIALTLGPLTIYKAGLIMAAQITLKSNAILLMIMALVTTMNLAVLGHAPGLEASDREPICMPIKRMHPSLVCFLSAQQFGPTGFRKPCFAGGLNTNFIACMNLAPASTNGFLQLPWPVSS